MARELKRLSKKFLCFILVATLTLSCLLTMSAKVTKAAIPTPTQQQINDATKSMQEAMEAFLKEGEELSELEELMTRLGGIASAGSGILAILQILGVMKTSDPTQLKLNQIIQMLNNMNDKLAEMDTKLDQIITAILAMEVKDEERARAQKARDLLSNWQSFKTSYLVPLQNLTAEYNTKLNGELANWWNLAASTTEAPTLKQDTIVLYADYNTNPPNANAIKKVVTYYTGSYGLPADGKADNGEVVTEYINIPVSVIATATTAAWDVDDYRENFVNAFDDAFLAASGSIDFSHNPTLEAKWNAPDANKLLLARNLGEDLIDTIIAHCAYNAFSKTDETTQAWVDGIYNAYNNYCSNVLEAQTGLDSILNVMYGTHAFEGEIKDKLVDICDRMITVTSVYGQMAMSVVSMGYNETADEKATMLNCFVNTINALQEKRDGALTGYDNFCYIVGGLVSYGEFSVMGEDDFHFLADDPVDGHIIGEYVDYHSSPWLLYEDTEETHMIDSMPAIVNDVYSVVLYHQYQALTDDTTQTSFAKYLNGYDVGIAEDFDGLLTTVYSGAQNFALSDNIKMTANNIFSFRMPSADTYSDGQEYYVNDGTADDDDIWVHDKVVFSYIDSTNGSSQINQILAARAGYIWKNWSTLYDNGCLLVRKSPQGEGELKHNITSVELGIFHYHDYEDWDDVWFIVPFHALKVTAVPTAINVNGPLNSIKRNDGMPYYQLNMKSQVPTPDPAKETAGDWSSFDADKYYTSSGELSDEYINSLIDESIGKAAEKGSNINLTDAQKADIAKQVKEEIESLREGLANNESIRDFNVFNLNDEQLEALAKEVLGDTALVSGGKSVALSAKNIKTVLDYEVGVNLSIVMRGGKPVAEMKPIYDISPFLVIWNSISNRFEKIAINDEAIQKLGIEASVKIPVAADSRKTVYGVTHYNSMTSMIAISQKNATVQGSGTNKFVAVGESSFSPFELGDAFGVDTGDHSNTVMYMSLIIMGAAAIAVTVLTKRKSFGDN